MACGLALIAPLLTLGLAAPIDGPPVQVPRDGRGTMAVGGIGAAASAVLLIGSTTLSRSDRLFLPSTVLGSLGLLASTLVMAGGVSRHENFLYWQHKQAQRAPSQGFGLAGSGGTLLTGGALAGVIGTTFIFLDKREAGTTLVGLSLASLAVGAGLTIAGVQRNRKFERRRSQSNAQSNAQSMVLSPSLAPLRGGAQLGLCGRF